MFKNSLSSTCIALLLSLVSFASLAQPTLSKVFTPNSIGPGSNSTLTYTITNGSATPVTALSFTNTLPTSPGFMVISDPSNLQTNCDLGISGSLLAPNGGGTIILSDARIAASQSCTITIGVTASTPGVYTNPPVTLSSSAGSSMSLPVDLTVTTTLPGFSKSFSPSSVTLGDKSTLTFTFDNTLNANRVGNLDFTDQLPLGMEIASPANASTDCVSASAPDTTLTAVPGSNQVALDANGSTFFPGFEVLPTPTGATCTVSVDVLTTGVGMLINSVSALADFTAIGFATDTLEVTATSLAITKEFVNDPVPPGGLVNLAFNLSNFDRNFAATSVAFNDDLNTTLAGLTFISLVSNDCGGTVSGVSGTTIDLTGGTIAAQGMCSIVVSLGVPAATIPGAYTNTTSTISATVNGASVVGNMASDDLYVEPVPVLTKEFLQVGTLAPDPIVNPGDDVILRFTVTNTSSTSVATDITFNDELTNGGPNTGFLPFPIQATLPPMPNPPCGAGSSVGFIFPDIDRQGLALTSGDLAAAGMAGDSCTFDIVLTVPTDMPAGIYTNTTGPISATVDGDTRIGLSASDSLTIIAAPQLTKSFTDDPVAPGGTVTLEFSLTHSFNATTNATNITFTDDLAPVLAGLTANGLPLMDVCGMGSSLSGSAGDTLLTLSGGTLAPGETCDFNLSLNVPLATAPGAYTNTTSVVSATVMVMPAISPAASDDLNVSGLVFTKEFIDDPVIAGETTTLRFTIENIHPTDDASGVFFTDNLSQNLTGLVAVAPLPVNPCGAGSSLSGTSFLIFVGGNLSVGESCSFDIQVQVPLNAVDGEYQNITSNLSATQGGAVTVDPATDILEVNSNVIQLTKNFTDDPVAPGELVTLNLFMSNLGTATITDLAFSDDLSQMMPGMVFESSNGGGANCASNVSGIGTSIITVSGVTLMQGQGCGLGLNIRVPMSANAGTYPNVTSSATGMVGGLSVTGAPATDDLDVTNVLNFTKAFDGPTTATGTAILTFTITNPSATIAANDLSFSDNLDDVISGLIATNVPAVPCGPGSSMTGIANLVFTGGNLAPMETCSFAVDVLVPASASDGVFLNITSILTDSGLKVANPATASLFIEPPPTFVKSFAPDIIGSGTSSTLSFTIDNSASPFVAGNLDFTDNMPAGMTVATPANASTTCTGGTITASSGASVVSYSGGSVAAGSSCTINVDITATQLGINTNTSGDLTSSSGISGTATDTINVIAAPLFTKNFFHQVVSTQTGTNLRFTIDNSANSIGATNLSFVDNMPSAVTITNPTAEINNCGGTLTAIPGTSTISYTGGSVAASGDCIIQVNVESSVIGTHINTSGDLTSSLGNSGTATDSLAVSELAVLSKSFSNSPTPTTINTVNQLTYVVNNTNGLLNLSSIGFSDVFTGGIEVANPVNVTNNCSGTFTTTSTSFNYTGASLAAGDICFVVVDVVPTLAGTIVSTSSQLQTNWGLGDTATSTMVVDPAPGFTKSFTPNAIQPGGTSQLVLTIDNSMGALTVTSLDFSDTFPAGLQISAPSNAVTDCIGGTLTAADSTSVVSYTGGSVAANDTCTISLDVVSSTIGIHDNVTGDLTSSHGNSGTASASLIVTNAPTLSKVFTDSPTVANLPTALVFTIDNNMNSVLVTDLDFTDPLPAGIQVANPANTSTTCIGGTLTAVAGSTSINYTGGQLAAMSECTISVDVIGTGAVTGMIVNTTSILSTSIGDSNSAVANFFITLPPTFTKSFSPNSIGPGGNTSLTFDINHASPTSWIDATDLDFTDNLPAGMVITNSSPATNNCIGGTLTANTGESVISYTGGMIGGGLSCQIGVSVTSTTLGDNINITGDLTSNTGNSGTATATLNVSNAPTFAKSFTINPTLLNSVVPLVFTIDNTMNTVDVNNLTFSDNLPAGMEVANPANPQISANCTGGVLTANPGEFEINHLGGTITAASSCTISVDIIATVAGSLVNTSSPIFSSLGNTNVAIDTLIVDATPTVSKAFTPAAIQPNAVSQMQIMVDNSTSTIDATGLNVSDSMPTGMMIATPANASTTCSGGVLTATNASSVLTYTGGTVPASSSCTITVDVTSASIGSLSNVTDDVTSSHGNSGSANATLVVTNAPVFSKVFTNNPFVLNTPNPLVFTIDNSMNNVDVSSISFTDPLPAGIVVASPINVSSTCNGNLTAAGSSISYSGGDILALSTCTISVDVIATATGVFNNVTSVLSTSLGDGNQAIADLTISSALLFSKEFTPNIILQGAVSQLEFTLDNSHNIVDATAVDFVDNMPSGLTVASPANASSTCIGGSLTATSGSSSIGYTGGTVTGNSTCTITVDVTASTLGTLTNVTDDLTSSHGNSGTATASLTIESGLSLSKSFATNSIVAGENAEMILTLTNNSSSTANAISFTDDLDAFITGAVGFGLPLNDVCGAGSLVAGSSIISISNASLAPNSSCQFSVLITVPENTSSDTYVNITSPVSVDYNGITVVGAVGSGAAGNIYINRAVQEIPTLNNWMLSLLTVLMLMTMAWHHTRRKKLMIK